MVLGKVSVNSFSSVHSFSTTLIEKWKKVLDNKGFGGAVLMDCFWRNSIVQSLRHNKR